jgi:hypothetical protein
MPVAAFLCLCPTLVLAQHDPGARGRVANTGGGLQQHGRAIPHSHVITPNPITGAHGPDECPTTPLWGAGQIFFMHDGRTNDLPQATAAHFSEATAQNNQTHRHAYPASEANTLIRNFNKLTDKQAILDFPSFASIERGLARAISFCLPAKSRLLAVFSKRSERSARHIKTRPERYS